MSSTLNAEEVNALMTAIQDGRVAPEASDNKAAARRYDLTSQDRIIRGQMPTLDAINEQVGSLFGVGLAGRTRLALRVTSVPATLLKFSDVNAMLAPPATVAVLALGTGQEQALLVLEPGMADSLLAAALGDRRVRAEEAPPAEARRELTSVEKQVLRRLLTFFTEGMASAWAHVLPLHPEIERFEPDPRLAAIAPPNDAAILCTFEISGVFNGRLHLAIPYAVVEPVKKQLASPPRVHAAGNARFAAALAAELEQVHVDVRARLGTATLDLSRVTELAPGDVLTLDTSEGSPLPIYVEGRIKFWGQPRVAGGAMAITIEQPQRPNQNVLSLPNMPRKEKAG